MKTTVLNLLAAIFLIAASLQIHAQGIIIDQQSAISPINPIGNNYVDGLYLSDEPAELFTQSFIPSLSAIDFVSLEFEHGVGGATVYVNIYNSSSSFPQPVNLLGSSTPVTLPSGFENNGLFGSGVADFYFSTPITLMPGQTYYIQPVCSSGGNQWAVVDIIGDAYPNGLLFAEGSVLQPPSDLWFQEGVVSVPEPSVLALIGFCGLLVFGFKHRSKSLVLFSLFIVTILPIHVMADSVVQATVAEAGLSQATTLPRSGTFWVMTTSPSGQLTALPYPAMPANLSTLPIYSVAGNSFIVDDTGGQLLSSSARRMNTAQATAIAQAQAATMAALITQITFSTNGGGGGFQYNDYNFSIDTNGLWLENLNENTMPIRLPAKMGTPARK